MPPQFDDFIDRNVYPTMKWNKAQLAEHFGNAEALPFWVADMDFPAPDVVVESLQQRARHGIYGYEYKPDGYFTAMQNWYATRQNWAINLDHIEQCPSVLSAIAILMNQHSEPGDGVIVQPPVFFEFRSVIRSNDRRYVKNALKLVDGQYQMDLADLEEKAADPKNKIMIVCSPHNPVGRVWRRDELEKLIDICARHDVLLISDEIHGDIVYSPHQFIPIATVTEDAPHVVACIAPAKTFNLPGMVDAMVVIPDEAMRTQFHSFAHNFQINKTNVFTVAAVEAAYRDGGPWLDDLLAYLQANIAFMQAYLAENLPQVKLIAPEGTYLVWVDFTELNLDAKALATFLAEDAALALNPGHWFGREGAGFARMNVACPRPILEDALSRLTRAVIAMG